MVDLNEWQLEYEGVTFSFGTHESGFPFTRQVIVGPAGLETDDQAHPLTDGVVFGVDRGRGRTLQFAGAFLELAPAAVDPGAAAWTRPLDLADGFERVWRGGRFRRDPKWVASLANLDRGRCVYGRPRNPATDHARVRHGWSTWTSEFATVDEKFYALEENMTTAGLVPDSVGGFEFATDFPMSTYGVTQSAAPAMVVGGTDETWPVLVFHGPSSNPSVTVREADGTLLFTVALQATLAAADVVIVDARPWRRGVTRNGLPANGLLRGSTALDLCRLPPQTACLLTTSGVVATSGASATVWWRDAYASL